MATFAVWLQGSHTGRVGSSFGHLNEQVQEAHKAAFRLADALIYLIKAQLGIGLEARLEPCCGWAVRQQQLKCQEAQPCTGMQRLAIVSG